MGTNLQYTKKTWNQWVVKNEKAKAIPGAIEFINYVSNQTKAKVFFISNRYEKYPCQTQSEDLEEATINNLRKHCCERFFWRKLI